MVNPLSEVRATVKTLLSEAGIRAVDYDTEKVVPPLALIVPDDNYVSLRDGGRFGHHNVAIQVLLLGPNATAKVAAEKMDEMIVTALNALPEEYDIIAVTAPGEARLNDAVYYGSVINIEIQISLGGES